LVLGRGYLLFISLPTINKPIDLTNETDVKIKVADDIKAVVPLCLDMFGALFADKRIEWVNCSRQRELIWIVSDIKTRSGSGKLE